MWQAHLESNGGFAVAHRHNGLLLEERAIDSADAPVGKTKRNRPARSVTVNVAESPLGRLNSRRLLTRRQFDAGERLWAGWERAQLAPRITMAWDAAPVSGQRSGGADAPDLSGSQIDAKRRFQAAIEHAERGLGDILWRVVCSGEGIREAETALGWPARGASWCSRSRWTGSPITTARLAVCRSRTVRLRILFRASALSVVAAQS